MSMSMITDVVVVTMLSEDDAIAHVNAALAADSRHEGQRLEALDTMHAGGLKVVSACVYAAAFSYVGAQALRDALTAAPWRAPGSVTICIGAEGDFMRLRFAKPA